MSIVDLHPEELFDKLAEGRLSDPERVRLQSHLATCSACRFELELRRDIADEWPAARSLSPVIVPDAGAQRAHRRAAIPDTADGLAHDSGASLHVARRRRPTWAVALAAALVAGVSVAAIGPRVRELAYERALLVRKQPASEAPRRARAAANAVKESDRAIAPAPAHVDEVPAVKLDDLPVAREAPSGESRVPAHASRTPSALFRSANEARRAGDDARAIALYRALESEFPSSPEARLSHATIGRLMLDRGDAQRALTDFDEYLSNGGAALGEEALVGRALALGKLGQKEAEASAWREVLRRFPRSIHARLAQTRLAALDEP